MHEWWHPWVSPNSRTLQRPVKEPSHAIHETPN